MSNKDLRRKRIRARLAEYDMTAATLAGIVGIDGGHLSKIINSRFQPSAELAGRIARALKTTASYLKLQ